MLCTCGLDEETFALVFDAWLTGRDGLLVCSFFPNRDRGTAKFCSVLVQIDTASSINAATIGGGMPYTCSETTVAMSMMSSVTSSASSRVCCNQTVARHNRGTAPVP